MWADKESDIDYLNFGETADLAVDIIKDPHMLPVSVGIYGPWGAGKSTILTLVQEKINDDSDNYIVCHFDAWLYQGFDDSRAALLENIANVLEKAAKDNQKIGSKVKALYKRVNKFRLMGLGIDAFLALKGLPTGGLLGNIFGKADDFFDSIKDDVTAEDIELVKDKYSEMKKHSKGLLKKVEKRTPPKEIEAFRKLYAEILGELGKTLVVFIDNLDRCLPENSIHTLEAIRLFLFLPNSAFVVATDEEMIRGAVSKYYTNTSDQHIRDYLDKLIQVPIHVPKVGIREIRAYIIMLLAQKRTFSPESIVSLGEAINKSLQEAWKRDVITKEQIQEITNDEDPLFINDIELADRISSILAKSPKIKGNPRIVKRLLNIIKMRSSISSKRNMPLDEGIITKMVIFERCANEEAINDLYNIIDNCDDGRPEIFTHFDNQSPQIPDDAPDSWKKDNVKDFIISWITLEPSLSDYDLRAAAYLSKETLPLSISLNGLSSTAKSTLEVLMNVDNALSTTAIQEIEACPSEEYDIIMEKLIDALRRITDWSNAGRGFYGAYLLAEKSTSAASKLKRFIDDNDSLRNRQGKLKPWLKSLLRDKSWFEGDL